MTKVNDPLGIILFGEISTVGQLARSRISRALPKGMELSHFMVLNHLAHVGSERTPAQIARLFHVTKGAMTNTLSKLEAAGHVHVRPDWEDARRKNVSISASGRAARDGALERFAPVIEDIVAAVGPEKVRMALPVLRELRNRLEDEG